MRENVKRIACWLLGIGLFLAASRLEAVNPADGTITVTPVATVSLDISPTSYAYGPLDVNTSSVSATAVTLTNNGTVDVTIDKNIQIQSTPAGWTAATIASPAVGLDTYALYVTTAATRPIVGDFTVADHLMDGTGANPLRGIGGGSAVVTTSGGALPSVDLWFRLDMPNAVTSLAPREITVRFTGTAQ